MRLAHRVPVSRRSRARSRKVAISRGDPGDVPALVPNRDGVVRAVPTPMPAAQGDDPCVMPAAATASIIGSWVLSSSSMNAPASKLLENPALGALRPRRPKAASGPSLSVAAIEVRTHASHREIAIQAVQGLPPSVSSSGRSTSGSRRAVALRRRAYGLARRAARIGRGRSEGETAATARSGP